MSVIQCHACHQECNADSAHCPHCGVSLTAAPEHRITYRHKTIKVRCLGKWDRPLNKSIEAHLADGWEIVSIDECFHESNLLSTVYKVIFRHPQG